MRLTVRGAMGMALSTSIFIAGNAFGYDDEDQSVYEFLLEQSSASASDLKEIESDLIQEMKKAKDRMNHDDLKVLKDEMKSLEAEKDFGDMLQTYVRAKLSSRTDWTKRAEEDQIVFKEAINAAKADIASLKLEEGKAKELKEKVHDIEKYPFQVVEKLMIKKEKNGEHKVFVTQELRLNKNIKRSDWNRTMQKKFENFSDDQMSKYLEKHVNGALEEESFEVGELETFAKDEASYKTAMDGFAENLSRQVSTKVFGASKSAALNDAVNDREKDLGSSNDVTSEIGELAAQLERETDVKGRKAAEADLKAKYDIAKELRKNPNLASNEDTCGVMLKVLGKERMGQLSKSSKMECEDFLKKKEAEVAETKKEDETEKAVEKQEEKQNVAVQDNFLQLVQHCQARRQMMANQNTARPIDKLIMPMYNALQARGAGCSFFGSFMGELMSTGADDDMAMAGLFGADPAMLMETGDDSAYLEKAKEHVERMAIPSYAGTKQLENQAQCLAKMSSLAGMSLQGIAATSPEGLMHPELISDPKIKLMMKYSDASRALLTAVNEEISARKSSGMGGLQPLDGRTPASGQRMNGTRQGGTSVPFRALNTSDSRMERGLPGRQNNRRNSATGAGAPRRSPPPNFLGQ